jgi:2-hydroxychromene-2-carboxylate isomerase
MPETIDVYWSFRSPYSYLATPDLLRLREDYDVDVNLRVVLPIAVRSKKALFDPNNMKPVKYIIMDSIRRGQFLGLPMGMPRPDPIVQNMETFELAEEQPHIFRLSKLGVEAQRQSKGIDFAANVSHLIFGGTENWDQGEHLAKAASDAGLNLADMEAAINGNGNHLDEVEANQAALDAAGHWGVPTMVLRGEPFFGQDRIDTLRWRLDQLGLSKA